MSALLSSALSLPSIAAALVAAAVVFYAALAVRSARKYAPAAGTIFHQLLHLDRLYDYHAELSRRHKTYRILVSPFRSYVYTSDPANVEHILKANFGNYGKGPGNYENLSTFFGDGIFAVDGEKWRRQRKLASHKFSAKTLRDYSSVVFRRGAAKLARIVSDASSSRRPFDIQELFLRSTMDSIFEVGFGIELNTLEGTYEKGDEFARAFDNASAQIFRRYVDLTWKLKRFLNIGSEARLKKDMDVINNFAYKVILERTQQVESGDPTVSNEDMLSRFLEEKERNPEKMSNELLKDFILNIVIAGRDSTAGTLTWFLYSICKHPDAQERIAKEVKDAIGADSQLDDLGSYLTEESLCKMQYLHAALTETLRLYPAVPMDGKECFSDDVLPDGHRVLKGDLVDYQPYAMGRMVHLWGDDAELFKPERWLDDNGVFHPESPFKFTAFQGGPRICLGKEFAYVQMKIIASTLLYFFEFKLCDTNMIPTYTVMINLRMRNGLYLLASPR